MPAKRSSAPVSPTPAAPRFTGARIFGVRPGSPLVFTVTATGEGPLRFNAEGLPKGVRFDGKTGRFSGKLTAPGRYRVKVEVSGANGRAETGVTLVAGSRLALTPPMGWNSWNCWGHSVSQEKVLESARSMAELLRPHGWSYMNIDDGWQGERARTGDHALLANEKFPDMAGLAEEVHGMGLRPGIYSSPWAVTYAGHRGDSCDDPKGRCFEPLPADWWPRRAQLYNNKGLYSFTAADARQYAEWGFDYLKYDWFPIDGPTTQRCAAALKEAGRDIVLSLSNSLDYHTLPEVIGHAQLWRTTNDLRDDWFLNTTTPLPFQGVRDVMRWHDRFQPYQSPGAWNDPDMLVVGHVGWGDTRPTKLTQAEQTTHFAMWCLYSAPLMIGCPLDRLDAFTLGLLTNDDLIAINQDECGVQASKVSEKNDVLIYRKPLVDGTRVLGVVNVGETAREVTVDAKLAEAGEGDWIVRDALAQKDVGPFRKKHAVEVEPHGIAVLMLRPVA